MSDERELGGKRRLRMTEDDWERNAAAVRKYERHPDPAQIIDPVLRPPAKPKRMRKRKNKKGTNESEG